MWPLLEDFVLTRRVLVCKYIYIYTYWIDDPRTNTDTAAAFTMSTGEIPDLSRSQCSVRRPLITWLASFLITSSLIFLVLLSPLFWFTHRGFLDIPLLYVPQVQKCHSRRVYSMVEKCSETILNQKKVHASELADVSMIFFLLNLQ